MGKSKAIKGALQAAAQATSRAELQAKAKSLGLPASLPSKDIQKMLDIVESDPKTWTQEDYEFIRPQLAIHQDLRPGSGERVQSIMSEGLKRGMVDYPESMESPGYSFSKKLESPDSYLFLRGGLKFREPTSPWLAEGNVPMFRINPTEGQSLYEAISSSAVKNLPKKAAGGLARGIKAAAKGTEKVAAKSTTPFQRSLEQGYEHGWLHGTTADVKQFDPKLRGETTGAASAKKGFFFVRDPITPPETMAKPLDIPPEELEAFKKAGLTDEQIEAIRQRTFEGNAAETASGYAAIGGGREYRAAMRRANEAEMRKDWPEYEKQMQIAEDIEIGSMNERQLLVAQYGERRDEMLGAITQAIYDRRLPQQEAENLDKWVKENMPYGWYNFFNRNQFNNLKNQLIEKIGKEKAQPVLDSIDQFQSVSAERKLAEGTQEGGNVMPVALRYGKPYIHDFEGSSYRDQTYSDLVDKAIQGGHDALILRNTYDPGGSAARLVDVGVVFEPGQIRSKFAEFDPQFLGDTDITKAKGGAVDHELKAWHRSQKMAKGGEVKMAPGGNPARIQEQLSAGVPVFMSKGPEGDIARQMILEEEDARRRAEAERQARIEALPFGERLAGRGEAARTLGSAIGRSMVAPFVAVAKGEEAAKQFTEDVPIPKTEAGAYYTGRAADILEGPAKALEAAKIPDTPLTELVPTSYIPGLGRQLTRIAGKAARSVDEAIPESLKNLPVGASIKPVGPEGEKLSVNQLIAKLEAGEDLTPEQRQKAEYSKAQKEKYAQANIARQAKEPPPKEEKVKVPATDLGFYSPIEKALANTTRAEGSGQDFINDIMKMNPSSGELEGTGIVDWLKTQDKVTKQDVQDYLNGNKIEISEVIRGNVLTPEEMSKMRQIERSVSRGAMDITAEDMDWYDATKARQLEMSKPLHEREQLMLPGGKNYREITLSLPDQPVNQYDKYVRTLSTKYGEGFDRDLLEPAEQQRLTELWNKSQSREGSQDLTYRSSHFPEKNILAHMRIQDMIFGGKKTLVIEEIQSDWHQEGRIKGYKNNDKKIDWKDPQYVEARKRETELLNEFNRNSANPNRQAEIRPLLDQAREKVGEIESFNNALDKRVPDAPYKKDWYNLAIKRLMKYAADNDYDQIALVGPEEQIRRGSLGTHVDGLTFQKNKDGSIKLEAEKGQSVVLDKTVKPEDLELYVGKNVAKKILSTKDMDGTLTGEDLMIGGEGMRQYYGRSYPDAINRIGKQYNANIEKREHILKEFGPEDVDELPTGEYDRYGREIMAYGVVNRQDDKDFLSYEYTFEKALSEANKKAERTSMWFMDLPAELKSDVKIGQSYKEGGAVTKDNELQQWHKRKMARGGLVKKLAEAAKKGSRMSRAEAEKAGYWHPISETKLAKPIGEYKATIIEDPGSEMTPRKTMTVEEMQGGVAIPLAGDRAAAGRIIKEIEGTPMDVRLEGGPDFMRMHPGAAWASGKGVLSMLADRIRMARESGQPIYGVYTAMSPQAVDFNTMMTESLLNQLDISDLRKTDIKEFNQAVKAVKGQGGKPKAPNFPGIDDPELREKLLSGPGGQRDAFVKAMAKAEFQKKGFPDVAAARLAVTEPELLDIPRGSAGYTVARLDPEGKIFEQSGHSTYPLDIGGEYAGGLEYQLPVEIMYPSHFEAKRLMGSTPTGAHKSLELFAPLQYLDQNWLDQAMQYQEMQKKLTGRKKGGLAQARK